MKVRLDSFNNFNSVLNNNRLNNNNNNGNKPKATFGNASACMENLLKLNGNVTTEGFQKCQAVVKYTARTNPKEFEKFKAQAAELVKGKNLKLKEVVKDFINKFILNKKSN